MRIYRQENVEGEIWPAYTDILMVTCLILILLAVTMAMIRNDDHVFKEREKRKGVFSERFQKVFDSEIRNKLVKIYSPLGESQTITFSDQLLFEPGDASLRKENGKASLKKLAKLLMKLNSPPLYASIRVKGHTDESPIETVEFPSNWHLSSARATSVVYFFTQQGIPPQKLTSIGYAEFHAQTPDGEAITNKAQKRRVEIELHYPDSWVSQQGNWK